MKKLLILLLSVMTIFTCFFVAGCGKDKNTMSAWELTEKTASGVKLEYYAVYYVSMPEHKHETGHSHAIKEIWLNADGGDNDINVKFRFSYSENITSPKTQTATTKFDAAKGEAGVWKNVMQRFADTTSSYAYTYVEVSFTQSVTVNELVFVTIDKTKFETKLVRAGERPQNYTQSLNEHTLSELQALVESGELTNTAINLTDEQDSFVYENMPEDTIESAEDSTSSSSASKTSSSASKTSSTASTSTTASAS